MGLEKIEELKRKLGFTTAELAHRSGIPKGTLDKILSGTTKDPKLETLKAVARVLGCTLDDFDDSRDKTSMVCEPTYHDTKKLLARNGKEFSPEQKLELIKMLSELN